MTADDRRTNLQADCSRCTGLCCVAPAFVASADFGIDKAAGQPCPHLLEDARCDIHGRLRGAGFTGCAVFDCFGAGQRVTQVTFVGRSWRQGSSDDQRAIFKAFTVLRQLHELLWYLAEAEDLALGAALGSEVTAVRVETEDIAGSEAETLVDFDAPSHRRRAGELLERVSQVARSSVTSRAGDRRNADLIGADLAGVDLHGASLRGTYLLGADLRRADLRWTDLLGADLRAADLRGADLGGALFLTRPQLEAAAGDASTVIPSSLDRPAHWVR